MLAKLIYSFYSVIVKYKLKLFLLLLHILSVDETYGQADGTYTLNIEKLVCKVCALACDKSDEHQRHCLRASSLQCLSAMVVL